MSFLGLSLSDSTVSLSVSCPSHKGYLETLKLES